MLNKRLKEVRVDRGLNQDQLAEIVDTKKTTISNYETGYSVPSSKMLTKLADALNVTTDYLLGRSDNPFFDGGSIIRDMMDSDIRLTTNEFITMSKEDPFLKVPVIDITPGVDCLSDGIIEGYEMLPNKHNYKSGQVFGLVVKSNNIRCVKKDDIVIVEMKDNVKDGKIAVVKVNEKLTLKRIRKMDGKLLLIPDDPELPPIIGDSKEIKVYGEVIRIIRNTN